MKKKFKILAQENNLVRLFEEMPNSSALSEKSHLYKTVLFQKLAQEPFLFQFKLYLTFAS